MGKVVVEFLRENAPWRVGERVTFSAERAQVFLDARVARRPTDLAGDVPGEAPVDPGRKTAAVRRYTRKA